MSLFIFLLISQTAELGSYIETGKIDMHCREFGFRFNFLGSPNEPMKQIRLKAIGNCTGIILPKDVLEKLQLSQGDVLYLLETKDGLTLTPYDPGFASQREVAKQLMAKRRNVLRKLAE